ncbi:MULTISPECIES: hypothetical protein [Pseudomonadaceae]|uniref:hypothetical protein n=1 Tax=Pseudomonadaceae TaxID=135621 RepID=UPI0010401CAD|nr:MULTISPECIES: hypothetical protein [Pseudomonadaceae]MBA1279387.1 hypothetical protein [Stutzerimonas stutzeri]MBC8648527.1 hypothetical protein [Pseudomonas sp. MT4]QXY90466.1 hypothetical protein GYM54_02070 [Pseudomonas sp. MTM4]TCD24353.1 hypothetical protein E0D86_03880 [Pseudomonas sp. IC_126]
MTASVQIRQPCPPTACNCGREQLLDKPKSDARILRLTLHEENRLLERLENLTSMGDLERMQQRMHQQLGIRVEIAPGHNEVRSMRGIRIEIAELPGLCRKTRQSIPAAIRRALQKRPEIAFSLLNAHDLLRDA